MPRATNWAYTDLSGDDVLQLTIGEGADADVFDVVQVTTSFARNEIPKATCMLAVGTSANNPDVRAAIHEAAPRLARSRKAIITFHPRGQANLRGDDWPDGPEVIFDGYFQGFSYRMISGQVQVIAKINHWLMGLGATSAFSAISHPQSPGSFVFPFLVGAASAPTMGTGPRGQAVSIADHIGFKDFAGAINNASSVKPGTAATSTGPSGIATRGDLWSAIKSFLCALTETQAWSPAGANACEGLGNTQTSSPGSPQITGPDRVLTNSFASEALSRIEGPSTTCSRPYVRGCPLPLFTGGIEDVAAAVVTSLQNLRVLTFANHTMWDLLVGHICPMFGMALIPLVDTAIIVADTPGFREHWEVEILPNDYSSMDYNPSIAKPLRGVALATGIESRTIAGANRTGPVSTGIGGCYVSTAPEDASGTIYVTDPPSWLREAAISGIDPRDSTGQGRAAPVPSSTTLSPATLSPPPTTTPLSPATPSAGQRASTISEIYGRYARKILLDHNLRTRIGSTSGILRFDIAPGSHVKLVGSPELFIGGEDELAATLYGDVSRVTVSINAESQSASTSFQLTNVRTEQENTENRTSTASHPLFDSNVVLGAPLVERYHFGGS